jgi:hypothetical protein
VVLVILLVGGAVGITLGALAALGGGEDETERRTVSEFMVRVESVLLEQRLGQALGGGFLILPELSQAVLEGQRELIPLDRLAQQAEDWEERASAGAEGLESIQTTNQELQGAARLMAQGLRAYATLAKTAGLASGLERQDREELLVTISQQLPLAASLFDEGYARMLAERARVDPEATLAPQPGAVVP